MAPIIRGKKEDFLVFSLTEVKGAPSLSESQNDSVKSLGDQPHKVYRTVYLCDV